ncbi:PREDICTED: arf-GAP with dual PH domain-containing protein 1-like [Priapulus caudatus]|uniref:Arf-GAP with dual PH domain-containing protein 1-like n=1 Tax=Priapulus caudatus TaxID=37621 RepID=A0ABM1ERF2_PRICU|nr:PREDICTED: arf-GAP with dual PH domain-containing protein 1-like [Priapulus caudatus]
MSSLEKNRSKLVALLAKPGSGNNSCADCLDTDPDWASSNLGVFLCTKCAGFHRNLGSHISKVKSLRLDNWESHQVEFMDANGNMVAKEKFEKNVPLFYRHPGPNDPDVLREQWIRAKYDRKEFTGPEPVHYLQGGVKEGYLYKRGKDDHRFQLRRFFLNEHDYTLRYFVKENKEPKDVIPIQDMNACFCPLKMSNPNGMQITYLKDGNSRCLYLYSEDGKDIVDWYNAIRAAKMTLNRVAFPGTKDKVLARRLVRDFIKEGWLWKTGPSGKESYKQRWFSLDDRRLMYFNQPMDAYPIKDIFLGTEEEGYKVREGLPPGFREKEQTYGFTLKIPGREFKLCADAHDERQSWMKVLMQVFQRPLSPQDNSARFR